MEESHIYYSDCKYLEEYNCLLQEANDLQKIYKIAIDLNYRQIRNLSFFQMHQKRKTDSLSIQIEWKEMSESVNYY